MRAKLYEANNLRNQVLCFTQTIKKNKTALVISAVFYYYIIILAPTGVGAPPLPTLNFAVNRLLDRLYWGIPLPQKPVTEKHIPKDERNDLICERYAEGESLEVYRRCLRAVRPAGASDCSPLVHLAHLEENRIRLPMTDDNFPLGCGG